MNDPFLTALSNLVASSLRWIAMVRTAMVDHGFLPAATSPWDDTDPSDYEEAAA